MIVAIIVILLFIGLAVGIQYSVKLKPSIPSYSSPVDLISIYTAMISSDWHIEPLYIEEKDQIAQDDWEIITTVKWDGLSSADKGDTLISVDNSAVRNFATQVPTKSDRLFFYTGDTFSHKLDNDILNSQIESTIMNNIFTHLKQYFDTDKIFYVMGNHNGRIDKGFFKDDPISIAWAQSLIDHQIFIPKSEDELDLFMNCGYYRKHIPNTTIDVICLNSTVFSNISSQYGCDSCPCIQEQLDQLNKDLEDIYNSNKFVYILAHYPIDTDKKYNFPGNISNWFWTKVDSKYQSIVRGILTGHTHQQLNNVHTWDSGEYKAHTWNIPSIYWSTSNVIPGKVSSYIKAPFPLNIPLELAETDVWKTRYKDDEKTSRIKWQN